MNTLALCAVLALTTLPWFLALRPRIGGLAAIAAVTLAVPTAVLGVLVLARAARLPLGPSLVVAVAVSLVAGVVVLARQGKGWGPVVRAHRWDLASAGAGALVALATFATAGIVPGAPRWSWAMLGDSASQLIEARWLLSDGGLALTLRNPVPLTPSLIAAVASAGRPGGAESTVLAHDLSAYASTWAVLIVWSCALAGTLGYAVATRVGTLSATGVRLAAAGTSLLPLGWFWTGYPIKFGFINAHVAYVVLLGAVLAFVGTLARPRLGAGLQALATVLTLVTWSPLAVLPATLLLVQAVRAVRPLLTTSRRARVTTLVVGTVILAGALLVGVRFLSSQRGSLGIPGGLAEFPRAMLPLIAAVTIALAVAARRATRALRLGIASVGVAAVVGLVVVLHLSGDIGAAWTYYPHKYAWLCATVLLTIATPFAIAVFAGLHQPTLKVVGFTGVGFFIAVTLGFGSWWTPGDAQYLRNNLPYLVLVEDDLPDTGQSPDAVAEAVLGRVGGDRLTIPWHSSIANDYRASFWLIQLERERALHRGDQTSADALWTLANFHDEPAHLCQLAALAPGGVTVETTQPDLKQTLGTLCPSADIVVEVV